MTGFCIYNIMIMITTMTTEQLLSFVSDPGRVGNLATVDANGIPNSALIGSAIMPDTDTLIIALSNNRSLHNLQQNGQAVFTVFEPADFIPAWQGARLYLTLNQIDYSSSMKQQRVAAVKQYAGTQAASTIVAAVQFSIHDIRPLLDLSS